MNDIQVRKTKVHYWKDLTQVACGILLLWEKDPVEVQRLTTQFMANVTCARCQKTKRRYYDTTKPRQSKQVRP